MANTYTLIASNTLSSSAASVTFSSIPNTYTDLVLRMSVRTTGGGTTDNFAIQFNGTTTNYSGTYVGGLGSLGTESSRWTNSTRIVTKITGTVSTSNTFSNIEMYLPNYLVSQNKPLSVFSVAETNDTYTEMQAFAGLWQNTSAITSVKCDASTYDGGNFVSGSSFFLYGIKSS